jgi:hypothetical protein
MDRFNALGRGMQIMLVAGVLLLIDTFLSWQDFGDNGVGQVAEAFGVDTSWSAWHGFLGYVMGLLLVVLVAWLIARLAAVDIPLPISTAMVAGGLATLILFLAVIKNLSDEESTIWSYIGVLLAIGVMYGAWLEVQHAGGMDTLRSEAASMRTAPAAPAAPATHPPAAPAAPSQPSAQTPPPAPAEPSPPATAPPTETPPPPTGETSS